jgi:ubiquinone/menaquinone biosynthesis C-methylase UbiE
MKTAAEQFALLLDAVSEQQGRLHGFDSATDPWAGRLASLFRFNPRRALGPNLEVIAGYVQPGDVLVDVGGGAGRVSLPLALRCKEVVVVDPSPSMGGSLIPAAARRT